MAVMAPLPDGPKRHLDTHVGLTPRMEEHFERDGVEPSIDPASGSSPGGGLVGTSLQVRAQKAN